jgi:hypothetical protein
VSHVAHLDVGAQVLELDKPVALWKRERAQDHAVDDTVDCGRGRDTERHRAQDEPRVPGTPGECPQGVSNVVKQGVYHCRNSKHVIA